MAHDVTGALVSSKSRDCRIVVLAFADRAHIAAGATLHIVSVLAGDTFCQAGSGASCAFGVAVDVAGAGTDDSGVGCLGLAWFTLFTGTRIC